MVELIKVALSTPIIDGDDEITVLEMRHPNVSDMVAMEKVGDGVMTRFLKLLECIATVGPIAVGQISAQDIDEISEVIAPFIQSRKKK